MNAIVIALHVDAKSLYIVQFQDQLQLMHGFGAAGAGHNELVKYERGAFYN